MTPILDRTIAFLSERSGLINRWYMSLTKFVAGTRRKLLAVEMIMAATGKSITNGPPTVAKINGTPAETSVVISLIGGVQGAVTLRCSLELAADLASSMLGTQIAPGSDDMKDAIGELLNMVIGAANTLYAKGREPFKLSVPTTIIGKDYSIHIHAQPDAIVAHLPFTCNGKDLSLEVYTRN